VARLTITQGRHEYRRQFVRGRSRLGRTVNISNNGGSGVFASQGNFSTIGSTNITNNVSTGVFNPGYGIDLRGGAHAQIGALFGPNVISGNPGGGASLQETAEISFWSIGQPTRFKAMDQ